LAAAIQSSLGEACAQAGLDAESTRFRSACLGFSGGPAGKESILREIVRSDRTLITDDAFIALAGATGGEPGLVVIAGTGSIAFGRNSEGGTARAGGWGYIFGDEGGAFWIARHALRAALRLEEGWGVPTALRAILLNFMISRDVPMRNINDLLHRCYTPEFPRSRVASFSVLVNQAAEEGDPVAREILDGAARELALLAVAVHGQLFETGEATLVTYSGGVFRSRILLARFGGWMASEAGVRVIAPVYRPAIGALLKAYAAVGLDQRGHLLTRVVR
jgi:N-acetylglucosamine kinase-like BadF-type ATPase